MCLVVVIVGEERLSLRVSWELLGISWPLGRVLLWLHFGHFQTRQRFNVRESLRPKNHFERKIRSLKLGLVSVAVLCP